MDFGLNPDPAEVDRRRKPKVLGRRWGHGRLRWL
jgi:hypothetical protein